MKIGNEYAFMKKLGLLELNPKHKCNFNQFHLGVIPAYRVMYNLWKQNKH